MERVLEILFTLVGWLMGAFIVLAVALAALHILIYGLFWKAMGW